MSANSKIEWTDHTFNPWIGCTKVSPACDRCYAEVSTPSRTLGVTWGAGQERHRTAEGNWELPKRWNAQAYAFRAEHGRRQRVFCASLADVFDNEVPDEWRHDLFRLIAATPQLDWLLLTKRIGNAFEMIKAATAAEREADPGVDVMANVWLGATICNQTEADRDISKLLAVPAAKRFLSIEPLLGPVDLSVMDDDAGVVGYEPLTGHRWHRFSAWPDQFGPTIDWVIVGGESGRQARPMHPDWARSLRDQCAAAGVPFLFKQWGEWGLAGPEPTLRARVVAPSGTAIPCDGTHSMCEALMEPQGKKVAGRLLDGVQHDGLPS